MLVLMENIPLHYLTLGYVINMIISDDFIIFSEWSIQRRHDSNGRFQYEKSHKRKCYNKSKYNFKVELIR